MTSFVTVPHDVRVVGGVVVREFHIPAGSVLAAHVHDYDHLSFLLKGSVMLTHGGVIETLVGPRAVEIKANVPHTLYALTDCVWDCLHALDVVKASGDDVLMEGIA